MRGSLPYHARLSFSLRLETSMGDDEGAGVEWMETRRQEEMAHAWDVVVHSGYVWYGPFSGEALLKSKWEQFGFELQENAVVLSRGR